MSISLERGRELWTVETMPEERGVELVDGALVVSPSPSPRHDGVVTALLRVLSAFGSGPLLTSPDVVISVTNVRRPDVVVLREGFDTWNAEAVRPPDVLLAIEVESPSSVLTDQVTKRTQYAWAGIPAYWLLKIDPDLHLTALTLPGGADAYVEAGSWGEGERVELDEPFPVGFDLSSLRD